MQRVHTAAASKGPSPGRVKCYFKDGRTPPSDGAWSNFSRAGGEVRRGHGGLEATTGDIVAAEDLARVSPLASAYVIPERNLYPALLAALVAHGTNLGLATMAQSTKGIAVDVLHHLSDWYLHPGALKATNRRLVDYHHSLSIASRAGIAWSPRRRQSPPGSAVRENISIP